MNKILLESHGYTTDNDIVATLRVVKDSIRKEGGVDKFPITRKLLDYLKKNFMAPFYGWGSTASRLEPLRGGSLLFTTLIICKVPGASSIKEKGR